MSGFKEEYARAAKTLSLTSFKAKDIARAASKMLTTKSSLRVKKLLDDGSICVYRALCKATGVARHEHEHSEKSAHCICKELRNTFVEPVIN